MSFVSFCQAQLDAAQAQFGTYAYHDKGAEEVMDLGPIMAQFKALSIPDASQALKDLLNLNHHLDPSILVTAVLSRVSDLPQYDVLLDEPEFEDLV